MDLRILIQVAVALFAVFGFYCAVRTVAELFCPTEQIAVAVEVRQKKDAEMLDILLHEAAAACVHRRRARLVVLVSTDLMDGTVGEGEELSDDYMDLLDRYGADCYLIEP